LSGIGTDEFQQARAALEATAASMAASSDAASADERRALLVHVEGMRSAASERAFNEHDLAFHLLLAALSGNRAIELLLASLNDIVRLSQGAAYKRLRARGGAAEMASLVRSHERVARAVIAGDAAGAAAAMHRHFALVR
jgi:GntR family transcriptional repressor for pyruvate dehydrogenase complex